MARTTCRVNPDVNTRRRLWGDSGGYCGNPACRTYLFPEDLDVDFGELAHVIPASPGGPRSVSSEEVSLESRAHHGNLILLCANCHTVIDKASKAYPSETLYRWKQNRVAEIHVAVGARRFETRAEARACIEQQLLENRAIHAKYVPVDDPYSEGDPVLSRRHARANILPNNRKILQVLEANQHFDTERAGSLGGVPIARSAIRGSARARRRAHRDRAIS